MLQKSLCDFANPHNGLKGRSTYKGDGVDRYWMVQWEKPEHVYLQPTQLLDLPGPYQSSDLRHFHPLNFTAMLSSQRYCGSPLREWL